MVSPNTEFKPGQVGREHPAGCYVCLHLGHLSFWERWQGSLPHLPGAEEKVTPTNKNLFLIPALTTVPPPRGFEMSPQRQGAWYMLYSLMKKVMWSLVDRSLLSCTRKIKHKSPSGFGMDTFIILKSFST